MESEIVINCKTEYQAINLMKFFHDQGFKWPVLFGEPVENSSLLSDSNWHEFKDKTCYVVNGDVVTYGKNEHFEEVLEGCHIVSFEEFMMLKMKVN